MNIDDDHLFHGAALIQIAEHKQFTSINALEHHGKPVRSAYKINDSIAVYLKYASKPTPAFKEYPFAFHSSNLKDLATIASDFSKVYLGLICVKGREICCLPYSTLLGLIRQRRVANHAIEDQYSLLVTLEKGHQMRVYMNAPGRKKTFLNEPIKVSRGAFPDAIFS